MKDYDELADSSEPDNPWKPLEQVSDKAIHDATNLRRYRPDIREVIARHQRAESRLHREAEAMEFDSNEIYSALERVQNSYDAFEGAECRPVVDHGTNYVAFALNGADWHALYGLIKDEIDDGEMCEYIALVTLKVMSDITEENWHSHNSLPLVVSQAELRDVLTYHEEEYEGPRL